jgi:DNA helicase II / ATP-dependent DNA helicase PcrA
MRTPTANSPNPIPWADSQLDVFRHYADARANADVQAVAGSGKTTTLMGLMELAAHLQPGIRIVYCAYNRRIVTEIEEKLAGGKFRLPAGTVTVGTFHSLLLGAIRAVPTHRWVKIDEWAKHRAVLTAVAEVHGQDAIPSQWAGSVKDLTAAARFSGYRTTAAAPGSIPLTFSPDEWRDMIDRYDISTFMPEKTPDAYAFLVKMAEQYLQAGLELTTRAKHPGPIDFDDMIWLPLVDSRMGRNIPQFDLVLVDEAQDLNYVRRMAVGRLCKPGGRVVAVGDPYQSIYAFTGAAYDSLDRIKADYQTTTLPLHVSYRCPRSVVAVAQSWVPHIMPADTAEEGEVLGPVSMSWQGIHDTVGIVPGQTAILCRNNQPLVRVFFELLRMQIPAVILGNDIAKQMDKVIDLAMAFNGRVYNSYSAGRYTVRQLADLLEKWESGQVAAYREAGKLWKVAKVEDICGGIRVLLRQMPLTAAVQDVQARIKAMFTTEEGEKADRVVLCSGHKSKGLEWHTVIWYGENLYQPSKYAKTAEDIQQEKNLCYVMATRAQKRLVRVNAEKEGK